MYGAGEVYRQLVWGNAAVAHFTKDGLAVGAPVQLFLYVSLFPCTVLLACLKARCGVGRACVEGLSMSLFLCDVRAACMPSLGRGGKRATTRKTRRADCDGLCCRPAGGRDDRRRETSSQEATGTAGTARETVGTAETGTAETGTAGAAGAGMGAARGR